MAIVQILDALLRPLFVVLAVATVSRSSEVAVTATALAAAGVLLVSFRPCQQLVLRAGLGDATVSIAGDAETLRRDMRNYLMPFVMFGAVSLIGLYGDRWVIQTVAGSEEVGIYAVMYQIASAPVVIALGLLNQFAYPIVFARQGNGRAAGSATRKDGSYQAMLAVSALVIGVLCVIAYVFGESVLLLFASRSFTDHHHLLWVLVVGVSFFHFAQQMTLLGFSARRPSVYVWPKLAHSLLLLIFGVVLGGKLGMQGVAIAFVAASIVYLALVVHANRRLTAAVASAEMRS
jgi:O-antigen/teichoic acid export membrane protein